MIFNDKGKTLRTTEQEEELFNSRRKRKAVAEKMHKHKVSKVDEANKALIRSKMAQPSEVLSAEKHGEWSMIGGERAREGSKKWHALLKKRREQGN